MPLHERIDSVIRWLGIALFGLLPFLVVPFPWLPVVSSKILLISGVLATMGLLWFISRFTEGSMRVPWHMLSLAVLLVPLAYLVSAWVTGFSSMSMIGTGTDSDTVAFIALSCFSLAMFASSFALHPRSISHALRAFMLGGTLLGTVELVHFFLPNFGFGGTLVGQTGNIFGVWSEFVMLIGLLFFLSISLSYTPVTRGWWKYLAALLALLTGTLLVIANYPDINTLLFIAILLLLLVRGYRTRALGTIAFWRGEWFLVLLVVLAAVVFFFGTAVTNHLPQQLRVVQTDVRPSWQATYDVGKQALGQPAAFLFGSGPNSFVREWGLHKPIAVNYTAFWNTDFNVGVAPMPTSFITVGLIGTIAWLIFLIAALFLVLRTLFFAANSPVLSLGVPISIAALYLLALQFFTIPGIAMSVLMYLMFGFLLATLVPLYIEERECAFGARGALSWVTFCLVALITAAFVCAGVGLVRITYANALVNRAVLTYNQTQNLEASSHYVSESLVVYANNDYAHRIAVQLGLLSLQQLMSAGQSASAERLQETLKDTIQHGLDAVSINGDDYQNWLFLAGLYAQLVGANIPGAYDKAHAAYQQALADNPTSPVPYLSVAQLELAQNNTDAALQHLQKAVELKPDFATAYYLMSQIYAAQKNYQTALQAAARAANYASGDPEAWYNLGVIAYTAQDYADAIAALRQSLAIQPQFGNALYALGLAYYQSGDHNSALAQFETLNTVDPNQQAVQQSIAELQAGKPLSIAAPAATSSPSVVQ